MNNSIDLLKTGLRELEIDFTVDMIEKFVIYMDLLKEWNKKINLTAIKNSRDIIVYHFLDSLSVLTLDIPFGSSRVLDIGTGAGFPGLPIKIVRPDVSLVLVDSVMKKTLFLKEAIKELNLDDVDILQSRAEDLDSSMRESFDTVVSRAVAELRILSEYCLPFVRENGYFISYKGPAAQKEVENSSKALKLLGGSNPIVKAVDVPFSEKVHQFVIVKKTIKTPKKYPRSAGTPKKSPL